MKARRPAPPGRVVTVLAASAIAIVAAGCGGNADTAPAGPAVTVENAPQGNQLHQFDGSEHAPFISVADYKPIYDRHDPRYVLVDVREAAERAQEHIPGDVWAPLADAPNRGWKYLRRYSDKVLVLYCDCPWAEAAQESVVLRSRGVPDSRLRVLHEGIPGWAKAGYPVVRGGDVCARADWPQACSGR